MPDDAALLIELLLAGLLGFSAHRAGVCTVKAVAEMVTTRRGHMLAGFARTALWVVLVTGLLTMAFGAGPASGTAWSLSVGVLVGGPFRRYRGRLSHRRLHAPAPPAPQHRPISRAGPSADGSGPIRGGRKTEGSFGR